MSIAQPFGSVVLLCSAEPPPRWESAARWLDTWLAKFLESNGVFEGRNLSWLYDRSVSILGEGVWELGAPLTELARVAATHGATFACEFALAPVVAAPNRFDELLANDAIQTLVLNPDGVDPADAAVLARVEAASRAGKALVLLGAAKFWHDAGVLDSPIVNATNFRIVPGGLVNNSRTADDPSIELPPVRTSACEPRFAVYVSPEGELYPCLGLIGIAGCRLGFIDEPPETTLLTQTPWRERLERWAALGPGLAEVSPPRADWSPLPRICALHRASLME